MKKKILLILIITILQTFSSFAQIKVYEVLSQDVINTNSCGTIRYGEGSAFGGEDWGFKWISTGLRVPVSITVELDYAFNCSVSRSVQNGVKLNNVNQTPQPISTNAGCTTCTPVLGSGLTTWTLNPSSYVVGGENTVLISNDFEEGINSLSGNPNLYARVTVNYSPDPEINIKGGTTSIVNNDVTPSLVDGTDYGSVSAGTSLDRTFTIENQGANPLLLTGNPLVSISGSSAFFIQTQPASATIAGLGSQTFVVKFNPTCAQAGLQTAVVSIANNDSDENPYTFTVQGTAVDNVKPTAIAKNITVQLDTAGSVTVNASQLNNGSTDNCGISNYKLALGTTGTSCNMVNEGSSLGLTAVSGVFNEVLFASYGTPTGSCGNYSLGGCNSLTSVSAVSGVLIGRSNVSILADNFTFGDPCVGTSKKLAVTARYGPAIASSTSSLTFSCTDIGVKNVVLYVTDNNGNVSTVNATITIEDKAVPVITSNGNKNVNADANACGAAVSVSATATDNCSVGTPTGVRSDAKSLTALYPVGTTTITWNVTDAKGNSAVPVTQSVVVTDAQNPTIATLSGISVNADSGVCTYASSQLTAPTATDNCSVKSIVATPASLVLGANTVTWTVTDGSNLTATSTQTVTVLDTQNPTIATLSAISVDADAGVCTYASSQLTAPTTTDNCSVNSIVATPTSLVLGANTVTWTVTDGSNLTATSTQTVTVLDTQNPTIATLSAISVDADAGVCTYASSQLTAPTATDNCSVKSIVATPASLVLGANTVTWTVTDGSDLTATSTQTVTVLDTQNPTIATLSAISVNADTGVCTYASSQLTAPTATDNCSVKSIVATPASLVLGANTVTWTVTDGSDLTATSTQTVTVLDTQNPTIATLSAISVNADAGVCTYASSQLTAPTTTDNCSVKSIVATPASLVAGDNIVTWTVTDGSNLTATSTQTVTVLDTQNPTIATLSAISVDADAGVCTYASSQLTAPTTTDNCSVKSIVATPASLVLGANTVTWTVTDGSDLTATSTQTVTVLDTQNPTIATLSAISVDADAGVCTYASSQLTAPTTTDNCSVKSIVATPMSLVLGANTVTWTVTDGSDLTATSTQTVTVLDTQNPTITCAVNQTQATDTGICSAVVAVIAPIASDNCGVKTLINDFNGISDASGTYPVGTTEVIWTATDESGNVSICTQQIIVEDTELPVVLTKNFTVQLNESAIVTIQVADIDDNSSDNCGIVKRELDITSFTCANIGSNTVKLTITDKNGNFDSKDAIVVVEDAIKPTIITKNTTIQLDAAGNAIIQVSDVDDNSFDNCEIATRELDKTSFTCDNVGPNTVKLTITDKSGNFDSKEVIVTVEDNIKPIVVTKNITVQLDPSGNVVIQAADVDDNSTDNCGIATRELDKTEFTCANIGPNTVKLKVTDKNGNFDIKDAIVTVENKIIPKVLTKNITLQLNAAGNVSIVAADIDNRSTFVCGIPTLAVTPNTFTCANVGVNIVTLTVTDAYGNVSSEKATVTIEDKIAATVLTKNATVQLDATGNAVITPAQIDNGSSDLCGIASVTVSPSTFSCNNVGANTVTLTVTDVNGNKSSATAIVTVQDNVLPIAKTKDLTVELDDSGNASITVNQINNGSSDNCSVASVSLDKLSFDCTNVGVNTVLLTVKDKAGNIATAIAKVTVVNKFGDNDNDGIPDNCDDDDDNDGIKDSVDNCPITFNPYQEDRNHNGIGDACDKDQVNISEAFTPNGDGINDTWVISNIEYYPASTVRVFNRWGTEVFVARNYQNDWDGHYKGNSSSLPESSSYYYQIDLDGDGAIDRQGWIYINR